MPVPGKSGAPMAFLRYNVSLGEDALKGTQNALARHGLKLVSTQQSTTTNTDWASVALNLKKTGAKWVGIQISETQGGQLLQAMHKIGYFPRVFGESDFSDAGFPESSARRPSRGFTRRCRCVCRTIPTRSGRRSRPISRGATGKTMTVWNAIGEVQALTAVQALKTMKAPTRDCLIEALQNIRKFDTGVIRRSSGLTICQGAPGSRRGHGGTAAGQAACSSNAAQLLLLMERGRQSKTGPARFGKQFAATSSILDGDSSHPGSRSTALPKCGLYWDCLSASS